MRRWAAKQLSLSARDRQITEGILLGRSNDEIGMDLNISRKTVEAHISKLFHRFGMSSRVELAGRAEREQWLARATSNGSRSSTESRASQSPGPSRPESGRRES